MPLISLAGSINEAHFMPNSRTMIRSFSFSFYATPVGITLNQIKLNMKKRRKKSRRSETLVLRDIVW